MSFSPSERERYARHFALPQVGEAGQAKLKNARVLIIGAGGLGSPVALYLAAAGVGKIGLVDGDTISLTNLQRQVLYTTAEISARKVNAAKAHLTALNPSIEIIAVPEFFTAANADYLLHDYDLVVDGSDNFSTRYLVNDACARAGLPLVFGAIYRFDGQVSVFGAPGPCYRCVYPKAPPAEAVPGCAEAGVLGVLPGVIGTLMATEVLKIILGIGETLRGRLLVYDALSAHMQALRVDRRMDCESCGANAVQTEAVSEVSAFGMNGDELKKILAQPAPPALIDVRSPEEFSISHFPGAQNFPLTLLAKKVSELPAALVFLCQSGQRSARAWEIFYQERGIKARHLVGGMDAFSKGQ